MKTIPLSRGYVTQVDDEDFAYLNQWKWQVLTPTPKQSYAARMTSRANGERELIYMHRLLANPPKDKVVDHIDGNGLNNQKANYRICTRGENLRNRGPQSNGSSPYKGITQVGPNRWTAQIKCNGTFFRVNGLRTPEDAAKEYDRLAREHHGEFAYQNFPTKTR